MAEYSISDPFFRQLALKLIEEIDNRSASLVDGGALIHGTIGIDAAATAVRYQGQVSYIEALKFALDLGAELDKNQYRGRTPINDGDD